MSYGTPIAIVGDSSSFCLTCAKERYGERRIAFFILHDAVHRVYGNDGEPLEVAREGMHDAFICGLSCDQCMQPLCLYTEACAAMDQAQRAELCTYWQNDPPESEDDEP